MLHVLTTNAWESMSWQRLTDIDTTDGGWAMHLTDSSERSPNEVARQIVAWCRRAVNGHAAAIRAVADWGH